MGLLVWDVSPFCSSLFNTWTQHCFLSDQEEDSCEYLRFLMYYSNVGVVPMVLSSFSQSQSYWVCIGLQKHPIEICLKRSQENTGFSNCSWPYFFMVYFLIETYDKQWRERLLPFLFIFQANISYFRSTRSAYFSALLYNNHFTCSNPCMCSRSWNVCSESAWV